MTKFKAGNRIPSLIVLVLGLALAEYALAETKVSDWSAEPPPEGWAEDAYSPKEAAPNFGDDYQPGAAGDYNAYEDPYHPLKNPNKDPGEEWNRKNRQNMPDDSPGVRVVVGDWDWGEKYFESEFESALIITNNCLTPQPVKIDKDNLPYLTIPENVVVPPGQTPIKAKIKLPPEPPMPILTGIPGEPKPQWGHVPIPPFVVPPGQPPPKIHQPNFTQINGTVTAWHPWAPSDGNCYPKRTVYKTVGHIHFRPPQPDPPDQGPSQLATPDVCEVYWNIGVPPAQLKDEDCTQKIRELAAAFIDRVLPPYIQNSPESWLWLPDGGALEQMGIQQLLGMKARASALMGTP